MPRPRFAGILHVLDARGTFGAGSGKHGVGKGIFKMDGRTFSGLVHYRFDRSFRTGNLVPIYQSHGRGLTRQAHVITVHWV